MVRAGNKAKRLSSVNPYHKNNSPSKGEFTATNSNAVIQKTKNFCCFFIALLESKLNFQQFEKKKKKKELHSSSVSEVIDSERRAYLNA